ncbi:MAG: hypothetical protein WBP79_17080, partial [Candidatus Acidiferrales bacterium]
MMTNRTRTSLAGWPAIVAAGILLLFAASGLSRARTLRRSPAPGVSPGQNAASLFASEKGKFRILVKGQQVGKEEFEIGPSGGNWTVHGTSEIQSPQGTAHVTGTLNLRADGTPIRYEWSTQGVKKASATIEFNGAVATAELRMEGARPYTQQFTFNSPRVAILDDNLYHQ